MTGRSLFDVLDIPVAPLDAGEVCPSIQDIALAPQLAAVPIRILGWTWPDGRPMKVKVRGLTFAERREANRAAIAAALAAQRQQQAPVTADPFDDDVWALEVVLRGLVEPVVSRAHLITLADSNAQIIDRLAEIIVELGKLPARLITAELERLAGEPIPPAEPAPGDPAGGPRG